MKIDLDAIEREFLGFAPDQHLWNALGDPVCTYGDLRAIVRAVRAAEASMRDVHAFGDHGAQRRLRDLASALAPFRKEETDADA